jgi:hypothetical protein
LGKLLIQQKKVKGKYLANVVAMQSNERPPTAISIQLEWKH